MENHYDSESGEWVTDGSRFDAIVDGPRFRELDRLLWSSPEAAWPLLLDLLAEVPADLVYQVGCGPLQSFVNAHGAAFVEQLTAQARESPRFREAVLEVDLRRGRLPEPVESRLVEAFGPRFVLLPELDPDDA